jgi:hypothetical protein
VKRIPSGRLEAAAITFVQTVLSYFFGRQGIMPFSGGSGGWSSSRQAKVEHKSIAKSMMSLDHNEMHSK